MVRKIKWIDIGSTITQPKLEWLSSYEAGFNASVILLCRGLIMGKNWLDHPVFQERRYLLFGLIVTQFLLAFIVWNIHSIQTANSETTNYVSHIKELQGKIIHLDEVLTMSTYMAAASGDSKWEERYYHFEPKLGELIQNAITTSTRY